MRDIIIYNCKDVDYNPCCVVMRKRHIADNGFIPDRTSGPIHQFTNFFYDDLLQTENIVLEKDRIGITQSVRTDLEKAMTQLMSQYNSVPQQCRSETIGCSKTTLIIGGYDNIQNGKLKMIVRQTTTMKCAIFGVLQQDTSILRNDIGSLAASDTAPTFENGVRHFTLSYYIREIATATTECMMQKLGPESCVVIAVCVLLRRRQHVVDKRCLYVYFSFPFL